VNGISLSVTEKRFNSLCIVFMLTCIHLWPKAVLVPEVSWEIQSHQIPKVNFIT